MVKTVNKDDTLGAKIRSGLSILQQSKKSKAYMTFKYRPPNLVRCGVCAIDLKFTYRWLPLNLE